MLGPTKCRALGDPVTVALDDLVPADHFYRHLDAHLDLSFIRDWIADAYPSIGRPSVDPVVVFKLSLVMVFEGIRSERQLLMLAADRLSVRWYLGYALDEPLPDAATLTRLRQRLGLPFFRRFFEHVVDLCVAAGLVWGQELVADATRVPANADIDSLVPRLRAVVDDDAGGTLRWGYGPGHGERRRCGHTNALGSPRCMSPRSPATGHRQL
jgi:transposase